MLAWHRGNLVIPWLVHTFTLAAPNAFHHVLRRKLSRTLRVSKQKYPVFVTNPVLLFLPDMRVERLLLGGRVVNISVLTEPRYLPIETLMKQLIISINFSLPLCMTKKKLGCAFQPIMMSTRTILLHLFLGIDFQVGRT